uniref:Putative conserved secreted protein n=1 Tax=Culex tarsalis TaxID=7177 RepID=A0A1Q3FLT3_CULTA
MFPTTASLSKFYHRMSILITVFITVNLAKIKAENCGQEELARCARPFQVLQSSTDLSIATKKEELDKICPDLTTGLQCIRSYTRRCMTLEQRDRFNKLYNGTHQFVRDLCREGPYQNEFLSHAPCLQRVKPDYEVCGRKYHNTVSVITQQQHHHEHHQARHERHHQQQQQLQNHHTTEGRNAEDDVRTVCCSFIEYLDCSEGAAKKTCGTDTARFTRGFLDKMSSTLITMYCEDYYRSNKCPSTQSSASSQSSSSLLLLMLVTLLVPTVLTQLNTWYTATVSIVRLR